MRYNQEEKEFVWDMEAEQEDVELEKAGEARNTFMARVCLPAMNDINPDLTFTAEVEDDYEDRRLPTLDFSLWIKKGGEISHSYYEKDMKSQIMLERDSAMSTKQKITIQANELTRRLYNINEEDPDLEGEVEKVIENYTKQIKNSGWQAREAREMVVSGYIGWKRRIARRLEEGGEKYRSAGTSLVTRTRKKLTGKEDWYKKGGEKRKRDQYDEEEEDQPK